MYFGESLLAVRVIELPLMLKRVFIKSKFWIKHKSVAVEVLDLGIVALLRRKAKEIHRSNNVEYNQRPSQKYKLPARKSQREFERRCKIEVVAHISPD